VEPTHFILNFCISSLRESCEGDRLIMVSLELSRGSLSSHGINVEIYFFNCLLKYQRQLVICSSVGMHLTIYWSQYTNSRSIGFICCLFDRGGQSDHLLLAKSYNGMIVSGMTS
jgi:hypothetical protein